MKERGVQEEGRDFFHKDWTYNQTQTKTQKVQTQETNNPTVIFSIPCLHTLRVLKKLYRRKTNLHQKLYKLILYKDQIQP